MALAAVVPDLISRRRTALAPLIPAIPLVALGAAVFYLYYPVLVDLVSQWRADENYSHGFLIPLVSAYLIWQRRERLQHILVKGSAWGYPVLLAGLILLIVSQAGLFGYPARFSLLVVFTGLTLFLGGPKVLRVVAFPLAYLLFMIPLPAPALNQIAFPLQLQAARLATGTLDVLNVPVLREGNIIDLPSMRLEVAEACSGIRSLISLMALAVIYAYFAQTKWGPRLVLALSAIPIALVANAARVTLTGVLVETVDPRVALGFYHTFSGVVIFGLAFGLLALEGLALSRLTGQGAKG